MRVLVLTKIFPNRVDPHSSTFNRQQFAALGRLCDVEILATIPWFPGASLFRSRSQAGRLVGVPREDSVDGLSVHHPRFFFVPKIGHGITGPLYAASLASTVLRYRGRVDVVLGSWAYPDGFAAVVLAGLLGVPSVVKLHGSDMNVVASMPGPRRLIEWALPRADRIVAVSRPLGALAVQHGAREETVDVVPNGIDHTLFRPRPRDEARRELGLPPEGPVVLYVGRLEQEKGVLDLLAAFERTTFLRRGGRLVLLGDGAARTECRRVAETLGSGVELAGARAHREIPTWMAAADVVALPSWNEGTPNVVLEALACGRRVVATSVGGVPDVLTSDTLGLLVPPRAPDALALALDRASSEAYEPAAIAALAAIPDWEESARRLHSSLLSTLEVRASHAA